MRKHFTAYKQEPHETLQNYFFYEYLGKIWFRNAKKVQKLFLIAQKKGPDALNATQKTLALNKVCFFLVFFNQEKTIYFLYFCRFWSKVVFLLFFFS